MSKVDIQGLLDDRRTKFGRTGDSRDLDYERLGIGMPEPGDPQNY
jgi:hypothetical protein